ncbi:hypothetical protein CR513_45481, partial [Mucuna pruriens]
MVFELMMKPLCNLKPNFILNPYVVICTEKSIYLYNSWKCVDLVDRKTWALPVKSTYRNQVFI